MEELGLGLGFCRWRERRRCSSERFWGREMGGERIGIGGGGVRVLGIGVEESVGSTFGWRGRALEEVAFSMAGGVRRRRRRWTARGMRECFPQLEVT